QEKGLLTQTPPLEFTVHKIQPGDWVLIKSWRETKLQPAWEGPFQVLLTTETALRTKEKGWTHYTRAKGPVDPPAESAQWEISEVKGPLKLTLRKKLPA
uniref:Murine leukemia virus integrase C-terminal domain-containing protein n=1 Tax=Salvator merianae TaxID=96440 RepID=A0A8D0C9Y9_SALMN